MKTKDNKCCVFPFVYRGKTYDSCVKARANSMWCSLSPSYDDDKRYGYCRGTLLFIKKKAITPSGRMWILSAIIRVSFVGKRMKTKKSLPKF